MPEITMSELLDWREERARRQAELRVRYELPLVSFTLNIPGTNKRSAAYDELFRLGKMRIMRNLHANKADIVHIEEHMHKCGAVAYFIVREKADILKSICESIEETDDVGRLFDIDVMEKNGEKLSRKNTRECFLCKRPAFECARSRAHSMGDISDFVNDTIQDFLLTEYCAHITNCAVRALLYEVSVTPKPGLVDKKNTGAHKDMTFLTFVDSTVALAPYFKEVTQCAARHTDTAGELFFKLRQFGKYAEIDMESATGGINTHKGAIFSLGLLCAAAALSYKKSFIIDTANILSTAKNMCAGICACDFKNINLHTAVSAGEQLYAKYGVTGVRGIAENGYEIVAKIALPRFKECLKNGADINYASVVALLEIMACTDDTNVLWRGGKDGADFVKCRAKQIISEVKYDQELLMPIVERFDTQLIEKNISPGGSADLLAVTLFLYFCENKDV